MMETLSGASGSSAVPRWTRCAPEACHSKVTLPPPGHGSPLGHFASKVHSPTKGSSWRSACSAVGCSIDRPSSCGALAVAADAQNLTDLGSVMDQTHAEE